MIPIKILSDNDVKVILDIRNTVACVENAYLLKANNQARLFPLISEDLSEGKADMDIKSGILNGEDTFGLKLVAWFGENEKQGLPPLTGLTMIFDLKTGLPKAIINARYLTAMRTGAAGAIGIKYLSKTDSEVLLVAGTGFQAVFQIAAAISVKPSLKKVYIYNPLRYQSAMKLQCSIKEELGKITNDIGDLGNCMWLQRIDSVDFIAVDNAAKALEETDTVITITPSRKAYISNEWVMPGTHFSCIGADMPGKQEIDEKIFEVARVFVDDIHQASSVGETQTPIKSDIIDEKHITEIGYLINGTIKGRTSDKDITIFDSTGIALQDLTVSNFLIKKAEELNIGTAVYI
ncbi:ornithine cyclodeaminase family protein [Anaerovirgula multivorans]|nr:ornithine cyclodeaminase family protein [Anaerovirgula multivorans]